MILEKGDMWSILYETDVFCFTANATIRKDDSLVMGAGLAKEVKLRLPKSQYLLGNKIKNWGVANKYGFVTVSLDNLTLAAFQVKYNWYNNADIDLIHFSCRRLEDYIDNYENVRIDMKFPGIGNGNLAKDVVLPIISTLPDNVHIWEY